MEAISFLFDISGLLFSLYLLHFYLLEQFFPAKFRKHCNHMLQHDVIPESICSWGRRQRGFSFNKCILISVKTQKFKHGPPWVMWLPQDQSLHQTQEIVSKARLESRFLVEFPLQKWVLSGFVFSCYRHDSHISIYSTSSGDENLTHMPIQWILHESSQQLYLQQPKPENSPNVHGQVNL